MWVEVVGDAVEYVDQTLDAGQVVPQAGREFSDPGSRLRGSAPARARHDGRLDVADEQRQVRDLCPQTFGPLHRLRQVAFDREICDV